VKIGTIWTHRETNDGFLVTHTVSEYMKVKGLARVVEKAWPPIKVDLHEQSFSVRVLEKCFERLEPGDDGYQAALSLFVAASSAKVDSHTGEIDRLTEELGAAQRMNQAVENFTTGDQ